MHDTTTSIKPDFKSHDNESHPLVSILVPVYNAERFIGDCLDSITAQDLEDFEILMVDDGSTDDSYHIMRQYSDRDPRIKLFQQENQGPASARNLLLHEARGKWIFFCDADDKMLPGALKHMLAAAEAMELDALLFSASIFYDTPEVEKQYPEFVGRYDFKHDLSGRRTGTDFLADSLEANEWRPLLWLMFVKRSVLADSGIQFVAGSIHDDDVFCLESILRAKAVARIPETFYQRRIRANSIMTSSHSLLHSRRYAKNILAMLKLRADNQLDDRVRHAISILIDKSMRYVRRFWTSVSSAEISDFATTCPYEYAFLLLILAMHSDEELEVQARRNDSLSKRNDVLTERVKTLNERVATLTARGDTLTERIATLTERGDTLTARVDTLTSKNNKLQTKVSALNEGVERRDVRLAKNQETINSLNETIAIQQHGLESLRSEQNKLQEALESRTREMEALRKSWTYKSGMALLAVPKFCGRLLSTKRHSAR